MPAHARRSSLLSLSLLIASLSVGCAANGTHEMTHQAEPAPTPAAESDTAKRPLLLNITAGYDDPHKVTMALQLAGHGLDAGRQVYLFFNVRGVMVAAEGDETPDVAFNDKPVRALLAGVVQRGAKVLVCPHCAKAMGLEADDLIDAAEFATAETLFAAVDRNAAVFTY
jgi:predicted peroxiredoxin